MCVFVVHVKYHCSSQAIAIGCTLSQPKKGSLFLLKAAISKLVDGNFAFQEFASILIFLSQTLQDEPTALQYFTPSSEEKL